MLVLRNWTIGRRLALVLSIILGLSLLSSVLSVVKLQELGRQSRSMIDDSLRVERLASDWMSLMMVGIVRTAAIARSSDPSLAEHFAEAAAKGTEAVQVLRKQLDPALTRPEEKAVMAKITELREPYLAARAEITKLKQAGDMDGAQRSLKERFEPVSASYTDLLRQLVDLQRREFDRAAGEVEAQRAGTVTLLVLTSALSLGVGALLAWQLTRSITAPLAQAQAAAQAIAEMDLSAAPAAHYGNDETGRLMRAIDAMRAALRQTVGQVRGAVESISTASQEIAAGSHDLSQRTEQAAANLQQTAKIGRAHV